MRALIQIADFPGVRNCRVVVSLNRTVLWLLSMGIFDPAAGLIKTRVVRSKINAGESTNARLDDLFRETPPEC